MSYYLLMMQQLPVKKTTRILAGYANFSQPYSARYTSRALPVESNFILWFSASDPSILCNTNGNVGVLVASLHTLC